MNDANPRRHYAQGGADDERDPYAQEPYYEQQSYGYDAYGRPVQSPPAPPQQQGYQDSYYDTGQQGYGGARPTGRIPQQPSRPYYEQPPQQQGYAPPPTGGETGQYPAYGYGTGQYTGHPGQGYDTGQQPRYDTPPPYGGGPPGDQQAYDTGQQQAYDTGQQNTVYGTGQQTSYDTPPAFGGGTPSRHAVYETGQHAVYDTGQHTVHDTPPAFGGGTPGQQQAVHEEPGPGRPDYHTEQFAFVDEESEESSEVIDWLKFSESRTERREEARRRSRHRKVGLMVLLVLALLGGTGYLWHAGKIPGLNGTGIGPVTAGGPQKRDVIVVHLLPVSGGPSSTALLVDNTTKKHGTTVLIPNSLQVTDEDGSTTTLDKSVDDGVGPTRDSLNSLLGTDISGSWRLDSPYLELLVDSIGNVFVDTDATVKGTGKSKNTVLVRPGKQQELSGQAAVAYATYRGPGESQTAQLTRFGQVMQAVLEKLPSDAPDATKTVQALAQILDPSLTEKQLGASLAQLADLAKTGQYSTTMLAVEKDGSLSAGSTDSVKAILGGSVKQGGSSSAQPRVSVKDATGTTKDLGLAQAAILNGGTYTYVPGGKAAAPQTVSQVLYADPARLAAAKDVAATLGLPASAVKKGKVPSNADIAVVLGADYNPSANGG